MMGHRSISRRRVLQGGVAAGILLTVPGLPMPAIAQRRELDLETLTLAPTGAVRAGDPAAHLHHHHSGARAALSTASNGHLQLPVIETDPFRMVGVSWVGGPSGGASLRVHGPNGWGDWQPLHIDPSEAPDDADERVRFSSPLWVDRADAVELVVPEGVEELALHRVVETAQAVPTLSTPAVESMPAIRSRASWGARSYRGTPVYASNIRLAVVHHSAGANGYRAADVPSIIAGIQRFHQDGRGWNDVAYNFFVDRFGQLWEGRAGGVDRAVIGGHTFGYNTGTIGVCYLGTATAAAPIPQAALNSITALLKWKFNQVHRVAPNRTTTFVPASANSATRFPAGRAATFNLVIGHTTTARTECPGQAMSRVDASILAPLTSPQDVLGIDATPGGGFYLVTSEGQAFHRGGAPWFGSMAGVPLRQPMLGLAATATGRGYWLFAADGGIFTFGDATFHGSTGAMRLHRPIVGMASTASGRGYWLVASDGGIFTFGDARFHGSMGGVPLRAPVIGMARTPSGRGYWLFASDGGVFTFGDARFFGSSGGQRLHSPAVGVGFHPSGQGYWLVLADGSVYSYNVPFYDRPVLPTSDPAVGMAVTPSGRGYWIATRGGTVHRFGDAT